MLLALVCQQEIWYLKFSNTLFENWEVFQRNIYMLLKKDNDKVIDHNADKKNERPSAHNWQRPV